MIETADLSRFWAKVDRSGECWVWLGRSRKGYGEYRCGDSDYRAHRVAYESMVGLIPHGLTIDHLCRNTLCVNPNHFEPVTREVNSLRGSINATRTMCKRGHPFDAANTYVRTGTRHNRTCRRCRADAKRRIRAQKKGSQILSVAVVDSRSTGAGVPSSHGR